MFHNYLITALRNFARHKLYSFINIAGLTVGLTCAIFIILFVRDELSYDKWIPGTENLYRIEGTYHGSRPADQSPLPACLFPCRTRCRPRLPEVKAAVHLERNQMTVATEIANSSILWTWSAPISSRLSSFRWSRGIARASSPSRNPP